MIEMQKEGLREKVNAVYGYAAISRILLTQTAATGFSEGQAQFVPAKKAVPPADPHIQAKASAVVSPVHDGTLRAALETLGQNILTRRKATESE